MVKSPTTLQSNQPEYSDSEKLLSFFIIHLNRLYCAKSHLQERLPELLEQASFTDLKHAITETMYDVGRQISRMEQIFEILNTNVTFVLCKGMIGMIEDAFTAIDQVGQDVILRDLTVLYYLQNIESIETASFHVLKLAASKMKDKYIRQLIKENYDEAKADRRLFSEITSHYIGLDLE